MSEAKVSEAVVVYCTFPDGETAGAMVGELARLRLIACGNIIGAVRSIYTWQGEVHDDPEALAILKTTAARLDAVRDHILERHPYDCPEVIAVPITGGSRAYLEWLAASASG